MYGFARGFRFEEEAMVKLLALGMVVAMVGMAMMPAMEIKTYLPDNKISESKIAYALTKQGKIREAMILMNIALRIPPLSPGAMATKLALIA